MNSFRSSDPSSAHYHSSAQTQSSASEELTFNYPSLGRLMDGGGTALTKMRDCLGRSHQEYERVIRRGSAEEATRATRIVEAYRVTLTFLGELEASGGAKA